MAEERAAFGGGMGSLEYLEVRGRKIGNGIGKEKK
jgi:hypothetical protein